MDVRSQRPLRTAQSSGKENAIPLPQVLHQRIKSVANMRNLGATAGSQIPSGLNVAPKRAAFGEVNTNIRATTLDTNPKVTAIQSIAATDKENGRGLSLLQPASRPKTSGSLQPGGRFYVADFHPDKAAILSTLANNTNAASRKIPSVDTQVRGGAKSSLPKKPAVIHQDDARHYTTRERVSEPTYVTAAHVQADDNKREETRRHPRHYMSQPHLRTEQQPVLRRTASRQLSEARNLIVIDDDLAEPQYQDALEELIEAKEDVGGVALITPPPELSEVQAEVGHVLNQYRHDQSAPAPVQSTILEVEEYWEEEDAELEEDQGYTTAHSYRSYGENTTGGLTLILAPKVTARVAQELELARIVVEESRTQDEVEEECWDVSMVAEYGDEIFAYMRELETRMSPDPHYMDMQTEIQWSMRSVLIDWVIQVHHRFSLLPETLFLTVNYIDRFLSRKVVSVAKLQLVGATAIFIAAKYEEITCPSVEEIIFMVDNGFTAEEILKAERFMLSLLGFELGWPGPMSFLRRISKADDYNLETRTLAKYFLEVTIMDERFVGSPPSFLAAGAHCLSRMMLKKGDWSQAHTHWSGYTWSQLRPLVNLLLDCCQFPEKHHQAVYEKYSDRRYKRASSYVQEQILSGFRLSSQHQHPMFGSCGLGGDL